MKKKPIYSFFKRIFDFICALLGFIISSPLWLIAIIGIEISDPGPIFYKARRIGKHDKEFGMYKFRSMRVDKGANEKSFKADTNRILHKKNINTKMDSPFSEVNNTVFPN